MKKFLVLTLLILAGAGIGWWALGVPRASDAIVAQTTSSNEPTSGSSVAGAHSDQSTAPVWRVNLQSAIAEARDQKKDILLLFSGNGLSAVQTPVEAKLASEPFRSSESSSFILARFDCHPDTSAADDEAATRDIWAERLNVKSFPFIVLLDGRGRACAEVDLKNMDPAALEPAIASLRQHRLDRDKSFAFADEKSGMEQAVALDSGLQSVAPYAQAAYQPVMEQIVADDPADKAHLREVYFPLVTRSRIDLAVQHEIYPLIDRRCYQAAIDRIAQLMSEESPPPEQKQLLLAFQGQLFANLGDNKRAISTLDEAIALVPDNDQAAKIKAVRDQIGQQPAAKQN